MSDECQLFGFCCNFSRYTILYNDATFHVGEDLISLLDIVELFFLLAVLFFSYSRLDRSVMNSENNTVYILPVFFAFVLLLTLWYSIAALLIILPGITDSFAISILFDGHAFFDNFLIVFSFFLSDAKKNVFGACMISIFLTGISVATSYLFYDNDCGYCSLFYPSNNQVYLWITLTVSYAALQTYNLHPLFSEYKYKPRKSMKIWLYYLIAIYLSLSIGGALISWLEKDIGFCIISMTEVFFVALYGPCLYYTLVKDSSLMREMRKGRLEEAYLLQSVQNEETNSNPLFNLPDMHTGIIEEAKKLISTFQTIKFIELSEVQIGHKIGAGGMGEVYYATWAHTPIALKRIYNGDKALTEWVNEVKIFSTLSHPNILLFMGISVHRGGDRYIITEFISGGSLYDILNDPDHMLSDEDVYRVFESTAVGMAYLHGFECPILHRDLKSHNLLWCTSSRQVKIADFGLSRPSNDGTMTATGTAQWSAPEVIRHERYSTKADVYSFGIVMYEVLAGAQPYAGMTKFAAAHAVAFDGLRPTFPNSVPPRYVEIAKRCLLEDTASRPSFSQIVEELREMDKTS